MRSAHKQKNPTISNVKSLDFWSEWLDYEPLSDTQIQVSMAKPEAEQAPYGMLQFLDGSWNMKCIVYCMPAF